MIDFNNKEAASIFINNKEVQTITIGGNVAYQKEEKFIMTNVVLTLVTGTEYSVTANVESPPSLTWTSAEINISNADQGPGNRNAYLTFTPSEVVNGVLTTANNINVWFSNPDTWFTLTVYNNGTVVDTQYITYTTQ